MRRPVLLQSVEISSDHNHNSANPAPRSFEQQVWTSDRVGGLQGLAQVREAERAGIQCKVPIDSVQVPISCVLRGTCGVPNQVIKQDTDR